MKIHIPLALMLAMSSAIAADVSGKLWSFTQGKVPGFKDEILAPGVVNRIWDTPPGLQADRLVFLSMANMSPQHWLLALHQPKLSKSEYLGTDKLVFAGQTTDPKTNVYRVNGGIMRGGIVQEWTDRGGHTMVIYSMQSALAAPKLARFVKP